MKKIVCDGKNLQRTQEGYAYIRLILDAPETFGNNLDALYDLLTELGTDTEISICSEEEMEQRKKKVFINASIENERLNIILTK